MDCFERIHFRQVVRNFQARKVGEEVAGQEEDMRNRILEDIRTRIK
jgi:hypothetical protein